MYRIGGCGVWCEEMGSPRREAGKVGCGQGLRPPTPPGGMSCPPVGGIGAASHVCPPNVFETFPTRALELAGGLRAALTSIGLRPMRRRACTRAAPRTVVRSARTATATFRPPIRRLRRRVATLGRSGMVGDRRGQRPRPASDASAGGERAALALASVVRRGAPSVRSTEGVPTGAERRSRASPRHKPSSQTARSASASINASASPIGSPHTRSRHTYAVGVTRLHTVADQPCRPARQPRPPA